jgi:predicted 3-demethylubiquinone-9 3-methyltransferase (glyoxalase superfamily)
MLEKHHCAGAPLRRKLATLPSWFNCLWEKTAVFLNPMEAISLSVDGESQKEVDALWAKWFTGGSQGQGGWLKDKFGLSWQNVPRALVTMLNDADADKAMRVMQGLFTMSKIDVARLPQAYNQQ